MIKRKSALDLWAFSVIPNVRRTRFWCLCPGLCLLEVFVCTIHILLFQCVFVVCVESIILGYFIAFGRKTIQILMKTNKN